MKVLHPLFEDRAIRRLYDEKTETWFFSVVDIVQILTQQPDFQTARKYWNKLKERLRKEGSQSLTDCHRFKLPAPGRFKDHPRDGHGLIESVPHFHAHNVRELFGGWEVHGVKLKS